MHRLPPPALPIGCGTSFRHSDVGVTGNYSSACSPVTISSPSLARNTTMKRLTNESA